VTLKDKEELLHNLHMSKALARLQNKTYWIWEMMSISKRT